MTDHNDTAESIYMLANVSVALFGCEAPIDGAT